jgi:hypothetical protein
MVFIYYEIQVMQKKLTFQFLQYLYVQYNKQIYKLKYHLKIIVMLIIAKLQFYFLQKHV